MIRNFQTIKSDDDPIQAIALSTDQKNIASTADSTIKIWKVPF